MAMKESEETQWHQPESGEEKQAMSKSNQSAWRKYRSENGSRKPMKSGVMALAIGGVSENNGLKWLISWRENVASTKLMSASVSKYKISNNGMAAASINVVSGSEMVWHQHRKWRRKCQYQWHQ
jgi:hypothetical protein